MNNDVFKNRLSVVINSEDSLNSLAKKAGVSEGLLRRYLKDGAFPRLDTAVAIANAASVSLDWLIGLTDDPEPHPKKAETSFDPSLLDHISKEISGVYLKADSRISGLDLVSLSGKIYADIVAEVDDPIERMGAVKMKMAELKKELSKPALEQDRSKRRA